MKNIILGVVAVIVTIVGVSVASKTPVVNVTTPAPVVNVDVPKQAAPIVNVQAPNVTVPAPIVQSGNLGAVSTLDNVDNPYGTINGVRTYAYRQALTASSSIICSIKNPLGATSTLVRYSVRVANNPLGTQLIALSTSTSLGSSSPMLFRDVTVNAGPNNGFLWQGNATTTSAVFIGQSAKQTGLSDLIILPNEYVNLGIATTTSGAGVFASYMSGSCSGEFRQL